MPCTPIEQAHAYIVRSVFGWTSSLSSSLYLNTILDLCSVNAIHMCDTIMYIILPLLSFSMLTNNIKRRRKWIREKNEDGHPMTMIVCLHKRWED